MKKIISLVFLSLLVLQAEQNKTKQSDATLQEKLKIQPIPKMDKVKSFEREDYDKLNILHGTTYYLFNGKNINPRVFIDYIDNEKIAGQGFCNMFFASIVKGKIKDIGTTRMACIMQDEKEEQKLLNFLYESKIIFDGKRITIKKDNKSIVFTPKKP